MRKKRPRIKNAPLVTLPLFFEEQRHRKILNHGPVRLAFLPALRGISALRLPIRENVTGILLILDVGHLVLFDV